MENITLTDIKKNNYSLIYHLIYQNQKLSKQEIANKLHLSLPTVTQNLSLLEERGLIAKDGQFESSVGRRATAYTLCTAARICIGVEILEKKVQILAIDLLGKLISHTEFLLPYANEDSYYQELSHHIQDFITKLPVKKEQILGVGFAVQALTSSDGKEITYGRILNCTGLQIDVFSKYLDYPCSFFHDAKCAATTELWVRKSLTDTVYLSIGKHLGGALIINGKIYMGKSGHSGTIEHMTVNPEGKRCYCGKQGCMETYCSVNALLYNDETLDTFFTSLRNGEPEFVRRWEFFLDILAAAINNLHLILDRDFILGGHIAPYLEETDIETLHKKVFDKTVFPDGESFISISHSPKFSVPIGAALPFVKSFLDEI